MSLFVQQEGVRCSFSSSDSWVILSPIEQSIKQKIEAVGTPLKDWDINIYRGVLTGYNEAFIISTEKRDEILSNCQTADERERTAALIRPILRGRDIKRYGYDWAGLWVILAYNGIYKIMEKEYPAIFAHLSQYEEQLKKRGQCRYTASKRVKEGADYPGQHHWLELDNNPSLEKLDDFSKPKVMWKIIGCNINFSFDEKKMFCNNAVNIMTGKRDYLVQFVGLMNSQLFDWYLKLTTEAEVQGGGIQLYVTTLEKTIVKLNFDSNFTTIVGKRIKGIMDDDTFNSVVFDAYKLTESERDYIINSRQVARI